MRKHEVVKQIFKKRITVDTFKNLTFVKPFQKKNIKFEGVRRKPGVLVVRYTNGTPYPRIRIGIAQTCMYLGAHSSLHTITKNGGVNIEFSFNPIEKKSRKKLRDLSSAIWMSYLCTSLEHPKVFERLNSLLTPETKDEFLAQLVYRHAFYFDRFNILRSTFRDYTGRTGWYVIKEEGEVVRVGQAIGRLPTRALSYFSDWQVRSGELYYNPYSTLTYEVAFIELPLSVCRTFDEVVSIVNDFEDRLIKIIRPRDNQVGKPKEESFVTIPLEELDGLESVAHYQNVF